MANTLLLRRRAAGVSTGWTPKSLGSNLVGWWRADDIAGLGNGASVSSWVDKSGNGNTLVAGTAAPTVVTSAISGKPAAAFNGTTQYLTRSGGGIGSIPNTGPCFVFLVGNCSTSGNNVAISIRDAARTEWMFYSGTNSATWFEGGVGSVASGGMAGTGLYIAGMGGSGDSNKVYVTHGNIEPTFPSKGTLTAPNTANQATAVLNVGSESGSANFYNGQIAELFVMNTKPTTAQLKAIAEYVFVRYGLVCGRGYNAASSSSIGAGNYDTTNTVIEIDAFYDPTSSFGHPYWFSYVPPPGSIPTRENPSVVYADSPTGPFTAPQTNPIVAQRATGTNADPHIIRQPDGTWYLYYVVGQDGTANNNGTFALTTSDPRTVPWSAPNRILPTPTALQSVVVWDGTGYVLFSDSSSGHVLSKWGRAATPLGPWTTETIGTLPIPGGRVLANGGEFDVKLSSDGSKFIAAFHDNDGASNSSNIWFAQSPVSDGVTWTVNKYPTFVPNGFGWDSTALYRPSFSYDSSAGNYKVWYSTAGGAFGYTTVDKAEVEGS